MTYRVFGSAGSPYSIKVRSYFRYKNIDHVWLVRNSPALTEEFNKHAKLPIVPLVIFPDGASMQDSTPIIQRLEALFPAQSIQPTDPALRFLSELLEEFADEWGNKWMMHLRWYSASSGPSAESYSRKIAAEIMSGARSGGLGLRDNIAKAAASFRERMLDRGFTVGSNQKTAPIIEQSYLDTIMLLDAHLARRSFIFGRQPTLADFGLAGQLYQCFTDIDAGELMRVHAPHTALWCEAMINPQAVGAGGFESWESLEETLLPLLQSQLPLFLRWSDANAKAVAAGHKEMSVALGDGREWQQSVGGPQRYHAKSLKEIRRKLSLLPEGTGIAKILSRCDCLELLRGGGEQSKL